LHSLCIKAQQITDIPDGAKLILRKQKSGVPGNDFPFECNKKYL